MKALYFAFLLPLPCSMKLGFVLRVCTLGLRAFCLDFQQASGCMVVRRKYEDAKGWHYGVLHSGFDGGDLDEHGTLNRNTYFDSQNHLSIAPA